MNLRNHMLIMRKGPGSVSPKNAISHATYRVLRLTKTSAWPSPALACWPHPERRLAFSLLYADNQTTIRPMQATLTGSC